MTALIADRYIYLLLALYFVGLWMIGALIRRDIARAQWGTALTGAIAGPLSEFWYFAAGCFLGCAPQYAAGQRYVR